MLAALNMALQQRRPQGVIHHSDQGSQYTSIAFGERCTKMGVRPSMGTVGDAYDNAMAESFFATPRVRADRSAQLADARPKRGWLCSPTSRVAYNPRRRHSALGQISPAKFEQSHQDKARTLPSAHSSTT